MTPVTSCTAISNSHSGTAIMASVVLWRFMCTIRLLAARRPCCCALARTVGRRSCRPRRHWPETHITLRGDGHYGRPEVLAFYEAASVDQVLGLPWRMLPPCFLPASTVWRGLYRWRDNGLWLTMNHILLMASREMAGREASPSAGVIDCQSVKTAKSGGPCVYGAGKKVKGRKRHILTDTEGNLVHAVIHTADIKDRDGAPMVPRDIIRRFPWLQHVFADGAYPADKLRKALRRMGK